VGGAHYANWGKPRHNTSWSHGQSYDLCNFSERELEMAALADDKGWTFDAFDPGTLRKSVGIGSRFSVVAFRVILIIWGIESY
jgi:hypothetical protein